MGFTCGKYRLAIASFTTATEGITARFVSVEWLAGKFLPDSTCCPINSKYSGVTERKGIQSASLNLPESDSPPIFTVVIHLFPVSGTPQAKATCLTPGNAEMRASVRS